MAHQQHASCIEACDQCAAACNHCSTACLQEQDVKMMARCIALDMDCAAICQLASAHASQMSEQSVQIAGAFSLPRRVPSHGSGIDFHNRSVRHRSLALISAVPSAAAIRP